LWGEDAVVCGTLVCNQLKNQHWKYKGWFRTNHPKKRRGREVDVWKIASYDTLLAKKIMKSIGSTPYFLSIKYVFIFELASIS
jgi:hypothetical protein